MSVIVLKLARPCPHCGEELMVVFRRDLTTAEGTLQVAVIHGLLESLDTHLDWRPIARFEEVVLPEGRAIPW